MKLASQPDRKSEQGGIQLQQWIVWEVAGPECRDFWWQEDLWALQRLVQPTADGTWSSHFPTGTDWHLLSHL